LGDEKAALFVELSNDWIDLHAAIAGTYLEGEPLGSLVYADFVGLFKEINGLQLLLFGGAYPTFCRSLRFVWEGMFRAHFADHYSESDSADSDPPGPSVDHKIAWLEARKPRPNWKTVVEPTLRAVLPCIEHDRIPDHYQPLWQTLNRCVHPSAELRYKLIGPSALLVTDSFDSAWAAESVQAASDVFDLVWIAVLSRFPKCVPLLKNSNAFADCPHAHTLINRHGAMPS
jgi:hypothetical protein